MNLTIGNTGTVGVVMLVSNIHLQSFARCLKYRCLASNLAVQHEIKGPNLLS